MTTSIKAKLKNTYDETNINKYNKWLLLLQHIISKQIELCRNFEYLYFLTLRMYIKLPKNNNNLKWTVRLFDHDYRVALLYCKHILKNYTVVAFSTI